MNENTNAMTETAEAPKKRGNPNWIKKDNVVKASVTYEYIKPSNDFTRFTGADPAKHYHWARKDDDIEMNDFAQKGYVPATGSERIMGDPFAAVQDTTGQTKVRGNRILMCCPKELYEAREQAQQARSRHVDARQAAQNDARKMSGQGVLVKPEGDETTKRESLEE
jgi:hypothetical protein